MNISITILCWLALSSFCYHAAKKKGRSPWAWFYLGLLFGILALITLYILPSRAAPLALVSVPAYLPSDIPPPIPNLLWYYLDADNEQIGPVSLDGLKSVWKQSKITEDTYLWNETLDDWALLSTLKSTLTHLSHLDLRKQ